MSAKKCISQGVWKGVFGDGLKISKEVYESGMGRKRGRGRPNRVWMDRYRLTVHDRAEWRKFLNRM